MKKFRLILTAIIASLLLSPLVAMPAQAQVAEPDGAFSISSVEVYRHCQELNDQLYLITATIENTTTPSTAVDQAYIVRVIGTDGTTELGSTTFYPYHDSGYDYGTCSVYLTADEVSTYETAGVLSWSGAVTVEINGNPTLHWLDTTAITAMGGAVADDGGVQTDETAEANSAAANDMTLLPVSPVIGDAYYFGSDGMFDILTVNIGTAGDWSGTYAWEYWDGDEWLSVSGITDSTVGFTAGAGNYNVTYTCPSAWQTTTIQGMDLYWLRFRVVAFTSIATQPLGTQSWTNTLSTPPSTESGITSWIDESTVSAAQDRLTIRLRSLASLTELDWGGTTDLVESVAGVLKLTDEGEEYFTNSIDNLRDMCPDLFADVMSTPDFPSKAFVEDFYMGGEDGDRDVYAANWYAQTFTTTSGYSINGVELRLLRVGSPGTITASITATAGGLPTGADLVSGTINGNDFTMETAGAWEEITFTDDYELANGTTYAIVVRATGGSISNYAGLRSVASGLYTGGQVARSADSGASWSAVSAEDFVFAIHATDAYSMSYRNRLAHRLVGTRFDMTNLGERVFGGLSRMWTSTIIWVVIACLVPAVFVARAVKSYKPVTLVFSLMMPFGALAGFVYLEVALVVAFLCMGAAIWTLFYRQSST